MTNFQKAFCVFLSLCFLAVLAVLPEPFFLQGDVYRLLPLYCFLEKEAVSRSLNEDPETNELLIKSNADYLGQRAQEENREEKEEKILAQSVQDLTITGENQEGKTAGEEDNLAEGEKENEDSAEAEGREGEIQAPEEDEAGEEAKKEEKIEEEIWREQAEYLDSEEKPTEEQAPGKEEAEAEEEKHAEEQAPGKEEAEAEEEKHAEEQASGKEAIESGDTGVQSSENVLVESGDTDGQSPEKEPVEVEDTDGQSPEKEPIESGDTDGQSSENEAIESEDTDIQSSEKEPIESEDTDGQSSDNPPAEESAPAAQSPGEIEASALPHPVIDLSPEILADYDYLLGQFFILDPNTSTNADQLNAARFLSKDLKIQQDSSAPQILIYHSHSQETFADSREGEIEDTVVGVGNYLTQLLTDTYGYNVIHVTEPFDIIDGEIDRSRAYDYARAYMEPLLEENPTIEVIIDLHRDGVPEDRRLVTEINGKSTAQVMFYNGLSYTVSHGPVEYLPNPYIEDNLAFSFQLEYQAAQYYPDFYRGIYLAGLRYNLHLRPKALLLEAGAQTNTVQEVKNAMEPFADILNRVLQGAQ